MRDESSSAAEHASGAGNVRPRVALRHLAVESRAIAVTRHANWAGAPRANGFEVCALLGASTARSDRHRLPELRQEALLANATRGHVAVTGAPRVDSAEFAVVSVGVGRGDEPFIRKTGNDLANSIIPQDDEIAVAVRKAISALVESDPAATRTVVARLSEADGLRESPGQAG